MDMDWVQHTLSNIVLSFVHPKFDNHPDLNPALLMPNPVSMMLNLRIGKSTPFSNPFDSDTFFWPWRVTGNDVPGFLIDSKPTELLAFYDCQSFCDLIINIRHHNSMEITALSVDFLRLPTVPALQDQVFMIIQQMGYLRGLKSLITGGSFLEPEAITKIEDLARSSSRVRGEFHCLLQITRDVVKLKIYGRDQDSIAFADLVNTCQRLCLLITLMMPKLGRTFTQPSNLVSYDTRPKRTFRSFTRSTSSTKPLSTR